MDWIKKYSILRARTEAICEPLETEDYVVQPIADVSPVKWHLGHTTWFFEIFLLKAHAHAYRVFDPNFDYVFNSYYESVGNRVMRTDRGNLSRPTVSDVRAYRAHVDAAMLRFLEAGLSDALVGVFLLGCNHEEQHQELMFTDIKYILGHNPLFPVYDAALPVRRPDSATAAMVEVNAGIYEIGFDSDGFSFDAERNKHRVYLEDFAISDKLTTNGEYLEFIKDGGYARFEFWHSQAWEWLKSTGIRSPMYWHEIDGEWQVFGLSGLKPIEMEEPVAHISYYEAYAFANWKGMRLPTEFEWEAACTSFEWGIRWEWTESAFLPYPGFSKPPGAIGEYNGKFMVNQKVLRGSSEFTSPGHSRKTYRNFFQPEKQWQLTGIRLAK